MTSNRRFLIEELLLAQPIKRNLEEKQLTFLRMMKNLQNHPLAGQNLIVPPQAPLERVDNFSGSFSMSYLSSSAGLLVVCLLNETKSVLK